MKKVYGVGINDSPYKVRREEKAIREDGTTYNKTVWRCPYHTKWSEMLRRCYTTENNPLFKTYKDCTVCEEWLTFTNFLKWCKSFDFDVTKLELDKDIRSGDSKIYSPETCCFVTKQMNMYAREPWGKKNKAGVIKEGKGWSVRIKPPGKRICYLGSFSTVEEASARFNRRRYLELCTLAKKEPDENIITYIRRKYGGE